MKVKKILFYNKPMLYLYNIIFLFIRFIINFLYYIFVFPFKSLIDFYKFMIQVNIFLRIKKIITDKFDLEFNNLPLEINYCGEEINELIKNFNWYQNNKNRVDIKGNMNSSEYKFEYRYRGIEMTLIRKNTHYKVEISLNGINLINVRKFGPSRRRNYEPTFF